MDVVAVVPARKNDFGNLVNKDLLPFGDKNLLTNKITQLTRLQGIRVIVTTEDEEIANISKNMGVDVLLRPKELSEENTVFGDLVEYVCKNVEAKHILWTCVTSPLIKTSTYERALQMYIERLEDGFDSLVSVQKLQRYLMDNNGALNYRPGVNMKRIEELPSLYIATNGIAIAKRDSMLGWKFTCGEMPYLFELNKEESIDICDSFDYQCAINFINYLNEV